MGKKIPSIQILEQTKALTMANLQHLLFFLLTDKAVAPKQFTFRATAQIKRYLVVISSFPVPDFESMVWRVPLTYPPGGSILESFLTITRASLRAVFPEGKKLGLNDIKGVAALIGEANPAPALTDSPLEALLLTREELKSNGFPYIEDSTQSPQQGDVKRPRPEGAAQIHVGLNSLFGLYRPKKSQTESPDASPSAAPSPICPPPTVAATAAAAAAAASVSETAQLTSSVSGKKKRARDVPLDLPVPPPESPILPPSPVSSPVPTPAPSPASRPHVDVGSPEEYVAVAHGATPAVAGEPKYPVLAIDCEMVLVSSDKLAVARVTAVDEHLSCVYESYCRPMQPIVDYNTRSEIAELVLTLFPLRFGRVVRFSGITAEILQPVTKTVLDVRRELLALMTPQTILVGHSLENDLTGFPSKNSLRFLSQKFLQRTIQSDQGGHSSEEDSRATMELALLCAKRGTHRLSPKEALNILTAFGALGKSTAVLGPAAVVGPHTARSPSRTVPCEAPAEAAPLLRAELQHGTDLVVVLCDRPDPLGDLELADAPLDLGIVLVAPSPTEGPAGSMTVALRIPTKSLASRGGKAQPESATNGTEPEPEGEPQPEPTEPQPQPTAPGAEPEPPSPSKKKKKKAAKPKKKTK
ncbi:putative small RNA degrading nuclease 5 [Paratrimastix pyriformis]|uniref:Small RNA degrading nuclease 5 n=1 Tax=Paratrimastix pyriformis TaxID=342808 RepID=A0ABQ8U8G2_9EUKA|nr:putative small RNA degrading nuclease 5 [Paratrimastix pyriformis]